MRYKLSAFLVGLTIILCLNGMSHASESFIDIDISTARTPAELHAMIVKLNAGSAEAVKNNAFSLDMQRAVLKKSEGCINKAVALHAKAFQGTEEQERSIFLVNREVLKRILSLNRKILDDYQEKLDEMENPLTFFKTPAWQQPAWLAATASFRLGWNNYYAGLLFPESDTTAKELLDEAVESFSRSLVDSKEDRVIITSVFGRGLCHKRLKAYKDALKDFKSVKEAVKKDDLLYLRCRYEEAMIASLTGNFKEVLRSLDEIDKSFPANKIPEELKASLKDLRASSLRAISEQTAVKKDDPPASSRETRQ